MQISGPATNGLYKVPAEIDGQNKSQSSLQSQEQQSSTLDYQSRDTVNISAQGQALNTQNSTSNAAMVVPEPARVEPGRTVQNVGQSQRDQPMPSVAPEQAALQTTEDPAATANTTPQQSQSPATSPNQMDQTLDATSQSRPPQQATIIPQSVSPQNQPTPQKPATESQMAAIGGLATGKSTINLSV